MDETMKKISRLVGQVIGLALLGSILIASMSLFTFLLGGLAKRFF